MYVYHPGPSGPSSWGACSHPQQAPVLLVSLIHIYIVFQYTMRYTSKTICMHVCISSLFCFLALFLGELSLGSPWDWERDWGSSLTSSASQSSSAWQLYASSFYQYQYCMLCMSYMVCFYRLCLVSMLSKCFVQCNCMSHITIIIASNCKELCYMIWPGRY